MVAKNERRQLEREVLNRDHFPHTWPIAAETEREPVASSAAAFWCSPVGSAAVAVVC